MNAQIQLDDKHRCLINKCMKCAGYPAALARGCGLNPTIFRDWNKKGKTMAWGTLIALVQYARDNGIVGPFFDVITLQEPPPNNDLAKDVYETAWMLQHLPSEERQKLSDGIAAAYGRYVAAKKDGAAV